MTEVRVLIVDDQEPFRRAMAAVVDETDGFVVVGSATLRRGVAGGRRRAAPRPGADGRQPARHRRHRGHPAAPRPARTRPVVVLLSTYDEDQFDLDGCGAAAYVAKAAFGPDRLSAAWAARRSMPRRSASDRTGIVERDQDAARPATRAAGGLDPVADRLAGRASPADDSDRPRSTRSSPSSASSTTRGSAPDARAPRRSRSRRPPPPAARTAARPPTASTCRRQADRSAPGASAAPARGPTGPAGSGTHPG